MISNTSGGVMSAAGLAARLKLLQVDCADLPAAKRQEFITEEVGRALEGMPLEKRGPFLETLAGDFPAWDTATTDPTVSGSAPPSDTQAVQNQLLKILAPLSPEAKSEFFRSLMKEAGLEVKPMEPSDWSLPEELRKKMGLEPGDTVRPEAALPLLALFIREFAKLEAITWETWNKLAPRSAFKREMPPGKDFRSLCEECLRGDIAVEPLQQAVEKSRKLITGLLAAIPLGGKAFAQEYLMRFLPQNIEDVIHSRGVSIFGDSMEKKCWNKYKELAHLDVESIEKSIRDSIAENAEELTKKT
jgi:hypothetical protein